MTRFQWLIAAFTVFATITAAAPFLNIGEISGHESLRGHVIPGAVAGVGVTASGIIKLSRALRAGVMSFFVGVAAGWVLLVHRQYLAAMVERRHFDIVFLAVLPAAAAVVTALVVFLHPRLVSPPERRDSADDPISWSVVDGQKLRGGR